MGIWNTVQKWQGKSVPPCSMIVAAAGSSCRMGGQDKLFAPLAGVPVLTRTLRAIDRAELVSEIVVAAQEERIGEPGKPLGQIGIDMRFPVCDPQSPATVHRRAPGTARTGDVHAFGEIFIVMQILRIEQRSEPKISVRMFLHAVPKPHDAMDGRAERRPVFAALFVIVETRPLRFAGEIVRKQIKHHDDVRLFEFLNAAVKDARPILRHPVFVPFRLPGVL